MEQVVHLVLQVQVEPLGQRVLVVLVEHQEQQVRQEQVGHLELQVPQGQQEPQVQVVVVDLQE